MRCFPLSSVHFCVSVQNLAVSTSGLLILCQYLWGNNLGDPLFDGVGLVGFKSRANVFNIPCCSLPFCLLWFSIFLLSFYGLILCGWSLWSDMVLISLTQLCIASLFNNNNKLNNQILGENKMVAFARLRTAKSQIIGNSRRSIQILHPKHNRILHIGDLLTCEIVLSENIFRLEMSSTFEPQTHLDKLRQKHELVVISQARGSHLKDSDSDCNELCAIYAAQMRPLRAADNISMCIQHFPACNVSQCGHPEWPYRQGDYLACWRLQGRFLAEVAPIYTEHDQLRRYCPGGGGVVAASQLDHRVDSVIESSLRSKIMHWIIWAETFVRWR